MDIVAQYLFQLGQKCTGDPARLTISGYPEIQGAGTDRKYSTTGFIPHHYSRILWSIWRRPFAAARALVLAHHHENWRNAACNDRANIPLVELGSEHRLLGGGYALGLVRLALEHAAKQLNILGKLVVAGAKFVNFAYRVHNRCVVTSAKFPTNFRQ
jgi:hypothetical protein